MDALTTILEEIDAKLPGEPMHHQRRPRPAKGAQIPRTHVPVAPISSQDGADEIIKHVSHHAGIVSSAQKPQPKGRGRPASLRVMPKADMPVAPIDDLGTHLTCVAPLANDPEVIDPKPLRKSRGQPAKPPLTPKAKPLVASIVDAIQAEEPLCRVRQQRPAKRQLAPTPVVPAAPIDDLGVHSVSDTHPAIDPEVIDTIIAKWRKRRRWHKAEKSLTLQAKAFCRYFTAGEKDEASVLFDRAMKGSFDSFEQEMSLEPFLESINQFKRRRKAIEKELLSLVKTLPIHAWTSSIHGVGADSISIAGIVGEAGDIAKYRSPSALWKRMGLAVINGERQRRVSNNKELAIVHGYNAERRSVMYLVGANMIKAGPKCPYRSVYDARRAHTDVTHPEWIKAQRHNDGMRIMTKKFLLHLWREWRRIQDPDDNQAPVNPAPTNLSA